MATFTAQNGQQFQTQADLDQYNADQASNTRIRNTRPPSNQTTQPVQPNNQPVYDYNTGQPLAPGQQQSQFNTQTGQTIGQTPAPTPIVTSSTAQNAVNTATQNINQLAQQNALTPPKPKKAQDFQTALEAGMEDQQSAYQEFKTALDDVKNGAFSYSPDEQKTLDATQKALDRTHAVQQRTNAAMGRVASLRRGKGIGDTASYEMAINEGISKLKQLDIDAAGQMAQARTAIKEKKLKDIYDSYNVLNDTLKQRNQTLQQLYQNANEAEKFAIDREFKERQFAEEKLTNQAQRAQIYQNISKMKQEMASTGEASLDSTDFGKNVKNSLAAIRFPSVADRKTAETAIAGMIASGNIKGAKEQLRAYAFNSMPTGEQEKLAGKDDAIAALDNIKTLLADFEAKGGNTNAFTGIKQKTLEKGGFYSGPASDIANSIALAIIDYRKAISGAAFTESEGAEYARVFPSVGKTGELNLSKINTLQKKLNSDIDKAYGRRITGYNNIVGTLDGVQQDEDEYEAALDSSLPSGFGNSYLSVLQK